MVFAVYLLSFLIAVALLFTIHSRPWYLHVLAIGAALALGFWQRPPEWNSTQFDMAFGAVIIFLLSWGIGGLLTLRFHHAKHA